MRVVPHWLPDFIGVHAITINTDLILIDPDRVDDASLIAHEREHQDQMSEHGTLTFWWRYLTSRRWRLHYELQAYRVSALWRPDRINDYAHTLATGYWLGITVEDARRLIEEAQ